jgi:hypothetical protein
MQLGKDNHVKMVGKRKGKVKYKPKGEVKGIMSERGWYFRYFEEFHFHGGGGNMVFSPEYSGTYIYHATCSKVTGACLKKNQLNLSTYSKLWKKTDFFRGKS